MHKTAQQAYKGVSVVTATVGTVGSVLVGSEFAIAGTSETNTPTLSSIGPNATLAAKGGAVVVPVPIPLSATPVDSLIVSVDHITPNTNGTETAIINTQCGSGIFDAKLDCSAKAYGSHDYSVIVGHPQAISVDGVNLQMDTQKVGDAVSLHFSIVTDHVKHVFDPVAAAITQNALWPTLEGLLISTAIGYSMMVIRYFGAPALRGAYQRFLR